MIFIYILLPLLSGLIIGIFGNPEKWRQSTMIGTGLLFIGMNLIKVNTATPIEQTISTASLVMALGALLLGRGVAMVIRQERIEKNSKP
jgi:hypothetical protein